MLAPELKKLNDKLQAAFAEIAAQPAGSETYQQTVQQHLTQLRNLPPVVDSRGGHWILDLERSQPGQQAQFLWCDAANQQWQPKPADMWPPEQQNLGEFTPFTQPAAEQPMNPEPVAATGNPKPQNSLTNENGTKTNITFAGTNIKELFDRYKTTILVALAVLLVLALTLRLLSGNNNDSTEDETDPTQTTEQTETGETTTTVTQYVTTTGKYGGCSTPDIETHNALADNETLQGAAGCLAETGVADITLADGYTPGQQVTFVQLWGTFGQILVNYGWTPTPDVQEDINYLQQAGYDTKYSTAIVAATSTGIADAVLPDQPGNLIGTDVEESAIRRAAATLQHVAATNGYQIQTPEEQDYIGDSSPEDPNPRSTALATLVANNVVDTPPQWAEPLTVETLLEIAASLQAELQYLSIAPTQPDTTQNLTAERASQILADLMSGDPETIGAVMKNPADAGLQTQLAAFNTHRTLGATLSVPQEPVYDETRTFATTQVELYDNTGTLISRADNVGWTKIEGTWKIDAWPVLTPVN